MRGPARAGATAVTALAVLASATCLHAILSGASWFRPVLAAVAVVGLAGMAARRAGWPVAAGLALQLAGLTVLATRLYAPQHAWLGLLPTRASLSALRRLVGYGFADVQVVSPPAYPSAQLQLLAVLGVGLIAVATDLLCVAAGRPVLAGIPLLVLLAVPATGRPGGVGLVPFTLAAAGYLAVLRLDTAGPGRVVAASRPGGAGARVVATSRPGGARVGALALAAALLAPVAVPVTGHRPFAGSSGGQPGAGGGSARTVVNPFVQVASELHDPVTVPLLRVRADAPSYQRLTALEQFSAEGFALRPLSAGSKARVSRGLPPPPAGTGSGAIQSITEHLEADPRLAESFLPVPQDTTRVAVAGDWRLAASTWTIFSSRTTTRGASWTASAALPSPTAAQLRAAGTPDRPALPYGSELAIDLQVPDGLPAAVRQTAASWVREAGARTSFDIAEVIQDRLAGPEFHYDLDASIPAGPDAFATFLAERRGYCEQFAATMAAMLRTLGVPARVAVGFTAGTRQPDGSYLVTNRDAHAWPEVWLATAGWVRFEPTPLANGNALQPSYAPVTGPDAGAPAAPATGLEAPPAGPAAPDSPPPDKRDRSLDSQGAAGPPAPGVVRAAGRPAPGTVGLAAGLLAALCLLAPATVRAVTRRRRFAGAEPPVAARAAWTTLLEDAADRHLALPASASPRRVGALLGAHLGAGPARRQLALLVSSAESARYAAPGAALPSTGELREALRVVDAALAARLPWWARLGARLAPASARRQLGAPPRRVLRAAGSAVDRLSGVSGAARAWSRQAFSR